MRPAPVSVRHRPSNLCAGSEDVGQVAGMLVLHRGHFRDLRPHVSKVVDLPADSLEALGQPGIADGAWSHIDASSLLTEVQGGPQQGDGSVRHASMVA